MDLFGEHFWPDGVILLSLGMLIGYLAGLMVSRYLGGGKDVANTLEKTAKEHRDYKEEVQHHFATSAELLDKLTESYRDVYLHMAKSADVLCDDGPTRPLLDSLPQSPSAKKPRNYLGGK